MQVIRDEEGFGLFMIPLLVDWGIKRCNVKDCHELPNTIVTQMTPEVPLAGFCEKHYQEANTPGGAQFTLIFDDFDAFEYQRAQWKSKEAPSAPPE